MGVKILNTGMPKGVLSGLSPLEAEAISAMAPGARMKVREIHAVVSRKHKTPLTSIAVMLDRLYSKKLVDRKIETCRGGARYLYFLKKSHKEMEEDYLKAQVDGIISRFGDSAVTYFHRRFSAGKR